MINIKHLVPNRLLSELTGEVDDDLAGAVVVYDLELPDVSVLHHDGEEPDHHLGARPDQDLPLAALLRVVDALEAVRQ